MKKWFTFGIIGLLALGAMTMAVSQVAYAQVDQPVDPNIPSELGPKGWGHGFGRGPGSEVALQAAADALGMTPEELSTQLWGGKTLADLAEEKGVALEDVQAAVQAAQETAYRDSITQAVTDGTITQEHADWLLEGLDKGFIDAHGGMGGFHGRGMFGPHPDTPLTSPSTDS